MLFLGDAASMPDIGNVIGVCPSDEVAALAIAPSAD
jgi:hypothetical protein